jgi:hypothetical protein
VGKERAVCDVLVRNLKEGLMLILGGGGVIMKMGLKIWYEIL